MKEHWWRKSGNKPTGIIKQ